MPVRDRQARAHQREVRIQSGEVHLPRNLTVLQHQRRLDQTGHSGGSLEVTYRDGRLALGATRGDGRVGEDVTENVRTIRGLPLAIAEKRTLTLRGEVVLFTRDLVAINERRAAAGEEPFANPRNAAAGSLRLMDSREAKRRPLRLFFYEVVEDYYASHHEARRPIYNYQRLPIDAVPDITNVQVQINTEGGGATHHLPHRDGHGRPAASE